MCRGLQDLTSASTELNLTQLETGLTIAPSTRTMLPELLPVANPAAEVLAVSFLQTETDDGSSSCDARRLPTGETKVRFLDDSTGAEETGDTSSQASGPPLYGFVPPSAANEKMENHHRKSLPTFLILHNRLHLLHITPQFENFLAKYGHSEAVF